MPDIDVDFCFERTAGGYRLCGEQIREGPGGPDRHLRYAGGQGRDPGCWAVSWTCLMPSVDTDCEDDSQELGYDTSTRPWKINPELRNAYRGRMMQIQYLIDMARRLEGLPRHTSMHAAGVVISQNSRWMSMYRCQEPLTVPLRPSLP